MSNQNYDVITMLEKTVIQVLKKNNLLGGNKIFGVVEDVLNSSTLYVNMPQFNKSEMINCSPRATFKVGDHVLVEFINNNPQDKFVYAVIKEMGREDNSYLDYQLLPTEPVRIERDETKRACKFIYGYDRPTKTWSQELLRGEDGKVVSIKHTYPDGFILIRNLIRNDDGLLDRYE